MEDQKGILSSVAAGNLLQSIWCHDRLSEHKISVSSIIREEIDSGIPSNRVVLGGFSQGIFLFWLMNLTLPIFIWLKPFKDAHFLF